MKAFLREILITLVVAIVIFLGLQLMVQSYIIKECSMEPSFQAEQRLLVNKVTYKFHKPERGDVIVFHPPSPYSSKASPFIKRVIALPGETVEVKAGSVYVNGIKLQEPYIKDPPSYTFRLQKIPEDYYFVLGDNRNNSNDSHTGWILPRQNIIGKAWLIIWPPSKWKLAANYPLQQQLVGSMS
jgi:signal peptidase I